MDTSPADVKLRGSYSLKVMNSLIMTFLEVPLCLFVCLLCFANIVAESIQRIKTVFLIHVLLAFFFF